MRARGARQAAGFVCMAAVALCCLLAAPAPARAQDYRPTGTYDGITIDGDFDDWSAVPRHDVEAPDGTLDRVAMVWDGDKVYLYLEADGQEQNGRRAGNWNSVTWAGPYHNGQLAITSDLGRTVLLQPRNDGGKPVVGGIEGAEAAVNNTDWFGAPHRWEISIPASALPAYSKTIGFGLYGADPAVTGVADRHKKEGEQGPGFSGIAFDGSYDDWARYPHTEVGYSTPGTSASVVDAEVALYRGDKNLYGHAVTRLPSQVAKRGAEFLQGVTLRVNGPDGPVLPLRFATVGPDGAIDWNPRLQGLSDGTHEFAVACLYSWGTSRDAGHLEGHDVLFGSIKVTVGPDSDECEFELDLSKLAGHLHAQGGDVVSLQAADAKSFEVSFSQLGPQWVAVAGTSTAPALGVALAAGAVGLGALWRRSKAAAAAGGDA